MSNAVVTPNAGPRLDLDVSGAKPDAVVERCRDMDHAGDHVGRRTLARIAADEQWCPFGEIGAHEHVVAREAAGVRRRPGQLGGHRDPGPMANTRIVGGP